MGSSSSDSDSSDGTHDPKKKEMRKHRYEERMKKENKCVCHHCPPGVMQCGVNFTKKHEGAHGRHRESKSPKRHGSSKGHRSKSPKKH
ncbi:hypothetical protein FGIG_08220 [Fasciola gigantica]|uniref:Uncharacterized protein n=1 Tax=Fasciola gigantica TaxID=46835 RepID=A0A504YED9_FASGI|nr:hypothetical protein FGIG_08220 [Fasciola gigantica]